MDIEIKIDLDSMLTGEYKFPDFSAMMESTIRDGMKEVRRQGRRELLENMTQQGLGDTSLINSVVTRTRKDHISFKVVADHADFVEYGTGIAGMLGERHPNLPYGWVYASGRVSSITAQFGKGWYYPTTPDDPNPYKHIYKGQLYGYTMGLPARPYMHNTWLWAMDNASIIMEDVLHEEMIKLKKGR